MDGCARAPEYPNILPETSAVTAILIRSTDANLMNAICICHSDKRDLLSHVQIHQQKEVGGVRDHIKRKPKYLFSWKHCSC